MSSSPERQELLRNAVSFLADPKVMSLFTFWQNGSLIRCILKTQSSPLAKRIEFLESKGLTSPEIEEAMRQASSANSSVASSSPPVAVQNPAQQYTQSYLPSTYTVLAQPPAIPQLDWRDYFVGSHI